MNRSDAFTLSLVAPFCNEGGGIAAFFSATIPILESICPEWEIICIDDGSTDSTLSELMAAHHQNARIRVISLSRRFGKETALTAGLDVAGGDVIIPIDADLQDPPELIADMVAQWKAGFDVVLATRNVLDTDAGLRYVLAKLYYRLINALSDVDIRPYTGDFRLMDRKVVDVIRKMPEKSRYMKGLMSWPGFKTTQIFFNRNSRVNGQSAWSIRRLFRLALDGIFSFSDIPVKAIGVAGSFTLLASIVCMLWHLLFAIKVSSFNWILLSIAIATGFILLAIAIVGEYVTRIYRETQNRPLYVINQKIGF